jgi:hypothetical protein
VAEAPRSIDVLAGELFAEGAELRPVYGAGAARVENGQVRLDLPARDGVVLVAGS